MRIVVMGGAGDMGSRAVEDLAATEGVTRVTVADRDVARASALAARVSRPGVEVLARGVDAMDHAAVVEAMRGHDVVASALGPFHVFEPRLVSAALDASVDYASICDDFDAAEAVLRDHTERARETGRVVVTGLGASPGISNVGIRLLADRLDTLDRVCVYVYQPLDAGGGEAVIRHMLHIMTGDVVHHRAGRRTLVPAVTERRRVEFPRFGAVDVWNMGHAEPVTVPRFVEGVRDVDFFMGYGRGARALVLPARAGVFRSRRATEATVRCLMAIERLTRSEARGVGAIRIDGWGTRDGKSEHRLLCGVGDMRDSTGLSLSVGAVMLARRELRTTVGGVYAPEAVLSPGPFVRALRAKGIEAFEDLAMTRPVEA
ncbi:MAG: saccharopine dehydrogenase NADP-binding domain-containing protein [Deltaproteobacteria bacterium]|nr:saccharopine dehydrogenase NADP-binding domain-containing protein [Deltaproteobacteria bacterium]